MPALEELKRAYRRSPSRSISLVTSLLCHPPSSFLSSFFYLPFFHALLWHALSLFHPFIFRHSRISFLLRSSRPCLLARGTLCLSSSVLFLSFRRRMARRRPDPRAYRSESKRRSWPKRDGRCFAPSVPISFSLSVSPSVPCRVPYEREKRTEIEDGGSEREMDKRMVLILGPLALPSRLNPAPFHYHDEPQSCTGLSPLFLFLLSPRCSRALSRY